MLESQLLWFTSYSDSVNQYRMTVMPVQVNSCQQQKQLCFYLSHKIPCIQSGLLFYKVKVRSLWALLLNNAAKTRNAMNIVQGERQQERVGDYYESVKQSLHN